MSAVYEDSTTKDFGRAGSNGQTTEVRGVNPSPRSQANEVKVPPTPAPPPKKAK
jgi:hypothetical protein